MPEVKNYVAEQDYANGKPGRYVLRISFEYEGRPYVLSHECNNPEVGRRILYEREADILDPPARPAKRKRAA